MRILFCDNSLRAFWNFRGEVAEHFLREGHEVGVVVPRQGDRVVLPHGVRVFEVKMNPNGSNPLRDVPYALGLWKIFRRERPDVVFNYTIKPNIYGALAARSLGIRAVDMVAGLGYIFNGDSLKKRVGRQMYRTGLRTAERVMTLNRTIFERLREMGVERLTLLEGGEGVNLRQYECDKRDWSKVRFLMIARVLRDKGYREYVKAAEIVRKKHLEVNVELLGPTDFDSPMGISEKELQRDVDEGRIGYLGETEDVRTWLGRGGTVMVLPSWHEGLSRSLMEACAMGCPCIASDIPGCREAIDDGVNGYLVAPHDAQGLAEAMIRVIELTPAERRAMGTASRQKAEREFGVERVIDKYEEILRSL